MINTKNPSVFALKRISIKFHNTKTKLILANNKERKQSIQNTREKLNSNYESTAYRY